MAFLDEFIANFNKYSGPAHLNRFEAVIISPFQANRDISSDRFTSFRVVNLTFPGKNIRTVTNETVYGPTYEMAQGLTYAESVSMNFYLSAEHRERQYFLNWIDYIYKPDSYDLEYYDNYNRTVDLFQLNKKDERIAGIRLRRCYPKTLGAIEYAQDNGEIGQINVELAFQEHVMIDGNGREVSAQDIPKTTDPNAPRNQRSTAQSPFGGLDFNR